jgi:hypothetical protein
MVKAKAFVLNLSLGVRMKGNGNGNEIIEAMEFSGRYSGMYSCQGSTLRRLACIWDSRSLTHSNAPHVITITIIIPGECMQISDLWQSICISVYLICSASICTVHYIHTYIPLVASAQLHCLMPCLALPRSAADSVRMCTLQIRVPCKPITHCANTIGFWHRGVPSRHRKPLVA